MRITCPHCQTIYQLQAVNAETTLVCHRCDTEFSLAQLSGPAQTTHPVNEKENTANLFDPSAIQTETNASADAALKPEKTTQTSKAVGEDETTETPDESESDAIQEPAIIPAQEIAASEETSTEPESTPDETTDTSQKALPSAPPQRSKARIMPWLFAVLLIIAGSGFWMNQDAWLDDPWLRSVLMNIGLDIQVRDKDWHIDPQSVEMTWLKRTHNDTVLVITGEVHNLLQSDLPPPAIHFTLYGRDNPDTRILERDLVITRPPLMQTIRKTPYTPPPKDITPVRALGKRGFILVLENMPQNAGNFTLSPLAR